MTVNNVSTYGSLQTLLQNIGSVQSDINTVSQQISSGEQSQTFQGLNGQVEQFTSFNAQLSRLNDYSQNNGTLIGQLQTTNNALSQVVSIANSINSLISSQTSGGQTAASFTQQMQSNLLALSSALNSQYGNTFIFSGTDTNTQPIKSTIPQPNTIGTPDANYYQGSNDNITYRIGDNQTLTPGINASNISFQQLFAGVQQALSGVSASGNSTGTLQNAESLVSKGLQGVIGLQASVNANIVNVQQVDTQNSSTQTYLKSLVSTISSADVVELSTQVAQDQSVLEATYSTFARISSLNLVSYLPNP